MSFAIKGQTALVTGANRGIGAAIAKTLLDQGATRVYGAVRKPDSMRFLQDEYGDKVVPLELDLTRQDTIRAAAERAADVSLLVNNAGMLHTATALSESAVDELKSEMETNVYGLMHLVQAFAPILKANGGGAVVQLNSVASLKCFPEFTTYCVSKAAAYSVTQALRVLLAEHGTAVVSVHPGPIATDMADAAGFTEVAEPPQLVAEAIVEALDKGAFHAFAGSLAKQVGTAYQGFAIEVVEADLSEA